MDMSSSPNGKLYNHPIGDELTDDPHEVWMMEYGPKVKRSPVKTRLAWSWPADKVRKSLGRTVLFSDSSWIDGDEEQSTTNHYISVPKRQSSHQTWSFYEEEEGVSWSPRKHYNTVYADDVSRSPPRAKRSFYSDEYDVPWVAWSA